MPIAAIFWLQEKIRPTIEREYKYIYSIENMYKFSLFPVKTGIRDRTMESPFYTINSGFIYIFMSTSKIGNAFIPYYVYFSSLKI